MFAGKFSSTSCVNWAKKFRAEVLKAGCLENLAQKVTMCPIVHIALFNLLTTLDLLLEGELFYSLAEYDGRIRSTTPKH